MNAINGSQTVGETVSNKAQLATPQGEVIRLIEQLNIATLNLSENYYNLDMKLNAIKRNEPMAGGESTDTSSTTDLGGVIAMITSRVQSLNLAILDTTDKVEL